MNPVLQQRFDLLPFSFGRNFREIPESELAPLLVTINTLACARVDRHQGSIQEGDEFVKSVRAQCIQIMRSLEERYGDGNYEQRQTLLSTVLRILEGRTVNLHEVFDILDRTLRQQQRIRVVWQQLDERRKREEEERIVVRNLLQWVQRAQRLASYEPPDEIARALNTLETYLPPSLAEPTSKKRLRRPKAGHQPEPWIKQARRRLRAIGVTSESLREDLLMGVGLIPFRSSESDEGPSIGRK